MDYFWFQVNPIDGSLRSFSEKNGYEYNIYNLIDSKRPKIISTKFIPDLKNKAISEHYRQSEIFDDLLIRQN